MNLVHSSTWFQNSMRQKKLSNNMPIECQNILGKSFRINEKHKKMKYMHQKEYEACQADFFNQAHKIYTPLIFKSSQVWV